MARNKSSWWQQFKDFIWSRTPQRIKNLFSSNKQSPTKPESPKIITDEKKLKNLLREAEGRGFQNPLHYAAVTNSSDNIKFLLQNGYKDTVNQEDQRGKTPIEYAKDDSVMLALIENGADPNRKDKEGKTPLFYTRDSAVIAALARKGADLDARDKQGETLLHYDLLPNMIDALVTNGANPNIQDNAGKTPLCYPYYNPTSRIATLVQKGADPNIQNDEGKTPLHYNHNTPAIRALVDNGADPNKKDKDGKTPLFYVSDQHEIRALTEKGADPNVKDKEGKTPLHYPQTSETVKAFLEAEGDIEAKDNNGLTPLFSAVVAQSQGVEMGASIGHQPTIQSTAVNALIYHKANVNAVNSEGKTVMDYVLEKKGHFAPYQIQRLHDREAKTSAELKKTTTHAQKITNERKSQKNADKGCGIS